jgi:hypothetical protein
MGEPHSISWTINLALAMSLVWVDRSPPQSKIMMTRWLSRVFHAIASANINPHRTDSVANGLCVAQVAEAGGVKTRKNSGFGANVAEMREPFGEDLSLLDLEHGISVSKRIRAGNIVAPEPVATYG